MTRTAHCGEGPSLRELHPGAQVHARNMETCMDQPKALEPDPSVQPNQGCPKVTVIGSDQKPSDSRSQCLLFVAPTLECRVWPKKPEAINSVLMRDVSAIARAGNPDSSLKAPECRQQKK